MNHKTDQQIIDEMAEKISSLRKEKKISVYKLSKLANVSHSTILAIEKGNIDARNTTLEKIFFVLNNI